jgi:small subunit ribosomal protein S1
MANDETEDFAALMKEFDGAPASKKRGLKAGELVRGRIVSIGAESVFVDLGGKAEGILERAQVLDKDGKLTVAVGDELEARVADAGGKSGTIILRKTASLRGPEAAAEVVQAFEFGIPVEGLVAGVNKGGFDVQVAGMRGFCPVSQIDLRFVDDPSLYVGQKMHFRITKLEPGRGNQMNLVLSRKALLEEEQKARAAELRKTLAVGLVVRGTVTQLKEYGAFVDLGGIEGLLHVSELGFQRVRHPSEVLGVGQEVEVVVTKIEPSAEARKGDKISLSLKQLGRDPWLDVADQFPAGSRVKGTVVRFQPFGAFVELAPGIEGLIHISQMVSGKRINHPSEAMDLRQAVEVTVLSVDPEQRRLSLALTSATPDDQAGVEDVAAARVAGKQGLGTFGDLLKRVKPRA